MIEVLNTNHLNHRFPHKKNFELLENPDQSTDYSDLAYRQSEYLVVGYRLMRLGRLNESEQILKFNLYLFPNAWNVYDSYGEALLLLGKLDESKKMYEKSLALNSENESAVIHLKEIEGLKKMKR